MKLSLPPGSDQEFFELLELARQGDRQALGRIIDRCRPYLLKIAHEEGDSDLQAKIGDSDVVQNACFDAVRSFRQFRGRSSREMLGWLRQILLNRLGGARDEYDAEKRAVQFEKPLEAEDGTHADLEASLTSPSEQVVQREEREIVERALRLLTEAERTIIELRQKDGLTFVEIARLLHSSEEAARKRWVRAIHSLQDEVHRLYDRSSG